MSDPRLTPANARVMADHLPEDGSGRRRVSGTYQRVNTPVLDLLRSPDGARDRQLLFGEAVTTLDTDGAHSFLQAEKDGYVGYARSDHLTSGGPTPTHRVTVPATHVYSAPDLKSPEHMSLSFNSQLTITGETGAFFDTAIGFVPKPHLTPLNQISADPVEVAALFLGTPYLWGGNSRCGIDCSGLIQAACLACAIPCLGDSDQQERALGTHLSPDTPPQRGDLLFWTGHVAWVVDADTLLHANAYSMSVAYENRQTAIARIATAGDGPVTSHKRL